MLAQLLPGIPASRGGSDGACATLGQGSQHKRSLECLTQRCHCELLQRLHSAAKGLSQGGTRVPADPRVGFARLNKFWWKKQKQPTQQTPHDLSRPREVDGLWLGSEEVCGHPMFTVTAGLCIYGTISEMQVSCEIWDKPAVSH